MLEIPCTLRCDECKETQSVILPATARYNSYESKDWAYAGNLHHRRGRAASRLDVDRPPKDKLRCPRCSGVK